MSVTQLPKPPAGPAQPSPSDHDHDPNHDHDSDYDSVHSVAASERPNPRHSLSSTSVRSSTASPTPSAGPSATELALQDQLASLTTAHSSLTHTLRALQVELSDLKRVYQDLQEENESYEVLLGERTLNGEVRGSALFRQSFHWTDNADDGVESALNFGFTGGLEAVGEEDVEELSSEEDSSEEDEGLIREADEMDEDEVERVLLESQGVGSESSGAVSAGRTPRQGRRRSQLRRQRQQSSTGEGGGMDLAAELEAASVDQDEQDRLDRKKAKKEARRQASMASLNGDKRPVTGMTGDGRRMSAVGLGEDLRSEVRQLREANKALTLYVSKIVDRVCSQEGFEKVLAVDYRLATPKVTGSSPEVDPVEETPAAKARPASGFFGLGAGAPAPAPATTPKQDVLNVVATTPNPNTPGGTRKGISWEGVTATFSGMLSRSNTISTSSPATNSHMKPLMLSEARRLDTEEDDDDIRARARLHREMAQLGIEAPAAGNQIWSGKRQSLSAAPPAAVPAPADAASPEIAPRDLDADYTEETAPLEAQLALQSQRAQEAEARAELAGGRSSGFTEPKRRRPGSMRSTTSSSRNSVMGLGISDPASGGAEVATASGSGMASPEPGMLGAPFSQTPGEQTPSPRLGGGDKAGGEGTEATASPTWTKVAGGFKRLSRGLSVSGPPAVSRSPRVEEEGAAEQ